MSDPIIKILQRLKAIEPSHEFKQRSLTLILDTPQNYKAPLFKNFFRAFQFSGALVMASLLIVIILGGLSILNLKIFSPAMLASLDTNNLNEELKDMDLKLKLSEVSYYEDSLNKISVALTKTSQNGTGHLDGSAIEQEAQGLNDLESETESFEEILDELML